MTAPTVSQPAPPTVTLLDEELALLAPEPGPLPWLDSLDEADQRAVVQSAARGLLVRGLAEHDGAVLRPGDALSSLLEPLRTGDVEARLVSALLCQEGLVLTALRPLPEGGVLVHDISVDGVHRLTALTIDEARGLLVRLLDPASLVQATAVRTGPETGSGSTAGVELDEQAHSVARLSCPRPQQPANETTVSVRGGGCWTDQGDASSPLLPFGAQARDRIVEELLAGLLGQAAR